MNRGAAPREEQLRQLVEIFWETFPPFWHRIRAHIRQVTAEQFDISVEQFHILRHIRNGRRSVSELAEAKQISRAAVSQAVSALVDKQLVARQRDPDDRRYVRLTLTESGNALLEAVSSDTRQWMVNALSALDEREVLALGEGLAALGLLTSE